MATENIEGTATDENGNPLEDATIYVFLEQNTEPDGASFTGIKTSTDSNGNFVLKDHPAADGTSQEWHVAGYYSDGTGEFNALSKPSVAARVGTLIPDSVVNRDADGYTFSTSDKRGTQIQIASGESFSAFGVRISANTSGLTTAYLYDNESTPNLITSVDISGLTSGDPFSIEADFKSDTVYNIVGDADGGSYDSGFAASTSSDSESGSDFDITSGLSNINDTSTNYSNFNDLGNPDNVLG